MNYEENIKLYENKIIACKKKKKVAGEIHKKDLDRELKRLKNELAEYKMNFKKYFEGMEKNH